MDRTRSPDPETGGVYYARRRAPTQDPPADASKHKRWNFKTFFFLRGRLVLMLLGLCGGSIVIGILNPPLQNGSSTQLLSDIKNHPGPNKRIEPIPMRRQMQIDEGEEQETAKNADSKMPRWAAAAAKRPRRSRLEATLAETAAEEEEGGLEEDAALEGYLKEKK